MSETQNTGFLYKGSYSHLNGRITPMSCEVGKTSMPARFPGLAHSFTCCQLLLLIAKVKPAQEKCG